MKTAKEALASSMGGSNIVASNVIDELWGLGYTVVRRQNDVLNVDERIIPYGMAYQWCATKSGQDNAQSTADFYRQTGWSPVPASRHDGIFAPAGYHGDIEYGGLILMEKPKSEVQAEIDANTARAQQQVADWAERNAAAGFSGEVRIQGQIQQDVGEVKEIPVGDPKPINQTQIPADLVPYVAEILKERDASMARFKSNDPVNDRAIALRHAIQTIRDRHKEELNAAQSDTQG